MDDGVTLNFEVPFVGIAPGAEGVAESASADPSDPARDGSIIDSAFGGRSAAFAGRIDLVVIHPDERVWILDFKAGESVPQLDQSAATEDPKRFAKEVHLQKYGPQLEAYRACCETAGWNVEAVGLIWVRNGAVTWLGERPEVLGAPPGSSVDRAEREREPRRSTADDEAGRSPQPGHAPGDPVERAPMPSAAAHTGTEDVTSGATSTEAPADATSPATPPPSGVSAATDLDRDRIVEHYLEPALFDDDALALRSTEIELETGVPLHQWLATPEAARAREVQRDLLANGTLRARLLRRWRARVDANPSGEARAAARTELRAAEDSPHAQTLYLSWALLDQLRLIERIRALRQAYRVPDDFLDVATGNGPSPFAESVAARFDAAVSLAREQLEGLARELMRDALAALLGAPT